MIVDGINYAAYKEVDSSLHDSDRNRLLGSKHYKSGRDVFKSSPWAEGDFEGKMAMLPSNDAGTSDAALLLLGACHHGFGGCSQDFANEKKIGQQRAQMAGGV